MFTNDGYALLIGVDDYSVFDASRRQPIGTTDLEGSRNDVRAFWRQCRRLGMKPANIRVLASPVIDFRELPGATPENVAPATEAEILGKTRWLAEKLAQKSKPTGLLTYSGHGDWLAERGLVLCPSDVTWAPTAGDAPDLPHAVPLSALDALLAPHAENLTVVLDTCHAGLETSEGAHPSGRLLSLTRRRIPEGAAAGPAISGRVLAATSRTELAHQATFDGQFRGVFSWALGAAMDQWQATQEGSSVRLDLSYGKLIETTRRLLSALWFGQTPELYGPAGIADLAVFHHGLTGHPGETREVPDRRVKTAQLDPGLTVWRKVGLTFADGTAFATVYVFNQTLGHFVAGREYWYFNLDSLGELGNQALTITVTDETSRSAPPDPGYVNEQPHILPENVPWGTGWTTDPVSGGSLYTGFDANGNPQGLRIHAGTKVTSVAWYQVLASGSPSNITPGTSFSTAPGSMSVPPGCLGYDVNQSTQG
jgi:hypothetical protein